MVDMIVLRTGGPGGNYLVNSKPCKECLEVMKKQGNIRRVYYSTDEGKIQMEKLYNMTSDHICLGTRLMCL